MSIRTWWKERSEEIKRVRKVRFVTELAQKLEAIYQEDNEGRLRHLVYHISPEIREMTTSRVSIYSFVDITMADHFTITTSDINAKYALIKAAEKVVDRLLDKRGIPSLGELNGGGQK